MNDGVRGLPTTGGRVYEAVPPRASDRKEVEAQSLPKCPVTRARDPKLREGNDGDIDRKMEKK